MLYTLRRIAIENHVNELRECTPQIKAGTQFSDRGDSDCQMLIKKTVSDPLRQLHSADNIVSTEKHRIANSSFGYNLKVGRRSILVLR